MDSREVVTTQENGGNSRINILEIFGIGKPLSKKETNGRTFWIRNISGIKLNARKTRKNEKILGNGANC